MRAIELTGITKRFGEVVALDDLALTVEEGEALCLFGPSGCGKTTLLRIVAGLELPDSGKVLIAGRQANGGGLHAPPSSRNVGMVFQDLALWPHMRVERHLDFVLRAQPMPRSARRARITELLDLCHLTERRRAYPSELSGGQQQRLALARALANNPAILLLDEPFANLDAKLREEILAELIRLKSERRLTIVFATHDAEEAKGMADRVLVMPDRKYSVVTRDTFDEK